MSGAFPETLTINDGSTVPFEIVGDTNGILYEIFMTTNLVGASITSGVALRFPPHSKVPTRA